MVAPVDIDQKVTLTVTLGIYSQNRNISLHLLKYREAGVIRIAFPNRFTKLRTGTKD